MRAGDRRQYDIITFDCYGTLVDWETGISGAFVDAGAAAGISVDPDDALDAYMEIEPIVEAEAYRPYREILSEAARRVAECLGWTMSKAEAAFLADSLPDWPVYDDTRPGLRQLHDAGYRLGILSNVDDDLLRETRSRLDVPFDESLIVTAEAVGSYKPARAHFMEARRRIGDARWLHAAQSWFHDVVPATELGIPVAWVNRSRERRPALDRSPELVVHSVGELSESLA